MLKYKLKRGPTNLHTMTTSASKWRGSVGCEELGGYGLLAYSAVSLRSVYSQYWKEEDFGG